MNRLLRDALLIAGTAVAFSVVDGGADTETAIPYGERITIVCLAGQITNSTVSQNAIGGISIEWNDDRFPAESSLNGFLAAGPCSILPYQE